jgi:hypothetical protein
MDRSEKVRDTQKHETNRKPYSTPQVEIYGNLRQLTHTVQGGNVADNPGQETNMTNV